MCDADQFVEVVQPGQILRVVGGLQFGAVSGSIEDGLDEVAEFGVEESAQIVEEADEPGDRLL